MTIALLALGAVTALLALMVLDLPPFRRRKTRVSRRRGAMRIRGPHGRCRARPVFHPDLGWVYEVRHRGTVTYLPPAENLVLAYYATKGHSR